MRWRKATRGAGSCTYAVSPGTASVSAAGETVSLQVSGESACGWTADSGADWAAISAGASGSGNGTVKVTVAANTVTSARTATGKAVTVTQGAAGVCAYVLTPQGISIGKSAGQFFITVQASVANCEWTADSANDIPWLTIRGTTTLTGSRTVAYRYTAIPSRGRVRRCCGLRGKRS